MSDHKMGEQGGPLRDGRHPHLTGDCPRCLRLDQQLPKLMNRILSLERELVKAKEGKSSSSNKGEATSPVLTLHKHGPQPRKATT